MKIYNVYGWALIVLYAAGCMASLLDSPMRSSTVAQAA